MHMMPARSTWAPLSTSNDCGHANQLPQNSRTGFFVDRSDKCTVRKANVARGFSMLELMHDDDNMHHKHTSACIVPTFTLDRPRPSHTRGNANAERKHASKHRHTAAAVRRSSSCRASKACGRTTN